MKRGIRVLVAGGTALARARAAALVARRRELELVGVARDASETLRAIPARGPDVLLLGSELLRDGLLEAVRRRSPLPVLLLTSSPDDPRVLAGLEEGAADFVLLPARGGDRALEAQGRRLGELIPQLAVRGRLGAAPAAAGSPGRVLPPGRDEGRGELVVMGASTGGPRAVQVLLEALPTSLEAAVIVALHMPAPFTSMYARRVDRSCRLPVEEATDGGALPAGSVRIIPGGQQATLFRTGPQLHVRLRPRTSGEMHAPSVDLTMRSAAAVAGPGAVGVVLTGMGDDGREGLAAIRAAGGFTLAESERTALIFGMPGEAIRAGAATVVLPLDEIAAALVDRCGTRTGPRPGAGRVD